MKARSPAKDQPRTPHRYLRHDFGATRVLVSHLAQLLRKCQAFDGRLQRGESYWRTRLPAQIPHPLELIPFGEQVTRHLKYPVSRSLERTTNAKKLILGRGRAGHQLSIDGFM